MVTRSFMVIVALAAGCSYQTHEVSQQDTCDAADAECGDGATIDGDGAPPTDDAPPLGDGVAGDADGDSDPVDPCASTVCPGCPANQARPRGRADNCCLPCERVDFGCSVPPGHCAADADCPADETCIRNFCGRAHNGDLETNDGRLCTPRSCWDNFDHYNGNCCPTCMVQCGTDTCPPESCSGAGCSCDQTKTSCPEVVCLCEI